MRHFSWPDRITIFRCTYYPQWVEVPASRYTHLPTTLEKFLLVILICNENFMTSKLLFATNFMRYLLLLQFFIIICHFVVVVQTVITRKNLFTLMNQFWKIYSIFTCNPISFLYNDVGSRFFCCTYIQYQPCWCSAAFHKVFQFHYDLTLELKFQCKDLHSQAVLWKIEIACLIFPNSTDYMGLNDG